MWGTGPLLNRVLIIPHVVRNSDVHAHTDVDAHGWKHVVLLGVVSWVLLNRELVWRLLRVGRGVEGGIVVGNGGLTRGAATAVPQVHG